MTQTGESAKSFPEEWLKHADRCWDAERENAERLNERKRQILTASAALFGLGLFSVQWLRDPNAISNIRWNCIAIIMRILLAFSLLMFGMAIAFMLIRLKSYDNAGSKSTASNSLLIPPDVLENLASFSDHKAKLIVFALTYDASLDLKKRNARTAKRLELAQTLFVCGIVLVFLAVLAYISTSYPPIYQRLEDNGHGGISTTRNTNPSDADASAAHGFVRFNDDSNSAQPISEIDGNRKQRIDDSIHTSEVQPTRDIRDTNQPVLNPSISANQPTTQAVKNTH